MTTSAVQEIIQLQQDLQGLTQMVTQLQQRLNTLWNHLQPTDLTDHRPPLAQLRGIWPGLDLSLEEIQAVEYQGEANL
jgi:hypothetical protein